MLSGPKAAKFTKLKEMIFCNSMAMSATKVDRIESVGRQSSSSCVMVYDYVEHDLLGIIQNRIKLTTAQVKYIMKEVLEAVDVLHCEHITHDHLKSKLY